MTPDDADKLQRKYVRKRRDTGELRDAVSALKQQVDTFCVDQPAQIAAGAAKGAAAGAAQAVVVASEKVTASALAKGFMASTAGKVIAGCTAFTTLMVALNNIPDLVRGVERLWRFLGGAS